jgi:hypothetical protein
MGLDQFAYIAANSNSSRVDDSSIQDLAYWRKHPNLHGWMERLWESKGCPGDNSENMFNGVELELTWEDVDRLEKDIKSNAVEKLNTIGFFFGDSSDEYYKNYDLEFCLDAKTELFLGRRVFYNSSW